MTKAINVDTLEDVAMEKPSKPFMVTQMRNTGLTAEDWEFLNSFDEKAESKIFHKVDIRLIPMLALLYLISHLDRSNIANAKIEGLEASLNMTGTDYNVALSIFFVPYILFEVPSNTILARFKKPSHYIGYMVIAWGAVMTLTGVVKNYSGLIAARFFLGLTEAGFFPAAIHIVSIWYPPYKTQTRTALFYCAAAVAGAFSGLLAAGIAQMDGIAGQEGWRWIFLIEGLASVVAGIAAIFLLPDFPSFSKWLTPEEARFLDLTHIATRGRKTLEKKEKFKWKILFSVLSDVQIYLQAFIMWSNTVPGYALKFTLPQIIRNMGFTSTTAQLLTAPPYVCAAISAVVSAMIADKYSWRMPILIPAQACIIIANIIQFCLADKIATNIGPCYFATFLHLIGCYPIIPAVNAWTINNLAGPLRRAQGIAFMVCMGNIGGIVGSYIFLESEIPKYPTGFGSSMAFAAFGMASAFALEAYYIYMNRKKAQLTEEDIREKYTEEQLEELGDKSPSFRYSL